MALVSTERPSNSGFTDADTTDPHSNENGIDGTRPRSEGMTKSAPQAPSVGHEEDANPSDITNHAETVETSVTSKDDREDGQEVIKLSSRRTEKDKERRGRRWLLQWGVVIVVAVIASILVRSFLLEVFYIPSGSMEPTLEIGNRILVDKLSRSPGRFNIVVFKRPPTDTVGPKNIKYLVKRVIGLPGNVISSQHCQVFINGKALPEPFLPKGTCTKNIAPQRVPRGTYFVMGDNRSDSYDSRYFGPIKASSIVGRVIMRIWPLGRLKVF